MIDVIRPHFTNVLRECEGEEEERGENGDEGVEVHFFLGKGNGLGDWLAGWLVGSLPG